MYPSDNNYDRKDSYFQPGLYIAHQDTDKYDPSPLLQWPANGYFERLKPDAELLQSALLPRNHLEGITLSEQVFGNELKSQRLDLKHGANLFQERCRLNKNHLGEIDYRHAKVQEKVFWLEENPNFPDHLRRLTNLQSQLLQLEQQRREEELAFWKDTVELRQQLFATAADYRNTRHRYSIFTRVEDNYGRK
jgi:hypothetical protein